MKLGFLVLNQSISSHNYNNQGAKFRASHDCNVIINEKKNTQIVVILLYAKEQQRQIALRNVGSASKAHLY